MKKRKRERKTGRKKIQGKEHKERRKVEKRKEVEGKEKKDMK